MKYNFPNNFKSKVNYNYNLSKSTWFQTNCTTDIYCLVYNNEDLKLILSRTPSDIPVFIIGVGSNTLVRDSGYNGLIIKLGKNFNKIKIKNNILSVGAGVLDINLAKFALKNSIKDFEFFVGIPGTIGGAVKMNAGCYGSQTSDNLKRVLILNAKGKIQYINLIDLNLDYRSSRLDKKSIILQADFNFHRSSYDEIFNKTIVDRNSLKIIDGSIVDFKKELIGNSFVVNNPKANSSCGCGLSFSV